MRPYRIQGRPISSSVWETWGMMAGLSMYMCTSEVVGGLVAWIRGEVLIGSRNGWWPLTVALRRS